ncbi:hypothetical protein [Massilia sp. DWR3-1-1]|uniref:hypothetical protein n=1 Tax=Massilia sp. DWR3-1-1 TaxID=2804559 RepID=UPI003CEE104F
MMKKKIHWRRPLFYLLLPIFFIMVFLGFPLPVAPSPSIKPGQEISTTVKKRKRVRLVVPREGDGEKHEQR